MASYFSVRTREFFRARGMPGGLRRRIAGDIAAAAADPALVERLRGVGVAARTEPPEAFAERIARQRTHWAAVAQRYGARPPA